MDHTTHNKIVNFIWGIADDVLRDVYVRGKYRDVILPMTVIRRLDVLLEPTKQKVLEMHAFLNEQHIDNQAPALRKAAGYAFYNTSKFTLKRLLGEPDQIRANFEHYLDGFSENVQEIIAKFKLRNQLDTLEEANILFPLIEKFVDPQIHLGPEPVTNRAGEVVHMGLSNLGMGYVFEELVRKFNEENNEEAGEHFTPREIIKLMTHLLFLPVRDRLQAGTYLIYDPACGTGGMLTEAEDFITDPDGPVGADATLHLYGQEINPETYAICKSDMLIKGEDADKIAYGSTLTQDAFPGLQFDFMLSNPPYGKSWSKDKKEIEPKKGDIRDPRFKATLRQNGTREHLALIPRSSDGQLLFLVNMLQKMKTETPLGSRVACIHNGSALFTGDAGQGESEIRRWILENDWLEAVIGLPLKLFYNTGIATYVWVLSNRKPAHRRGKVQLIDATDLYAPLRRNLGEKSVELTDAHIRTITDAFLRFEETERSKIFDVEEFGYYKITVERPLRLAVQLSDERVAAFTANPDTAHLAPLVPVLREAFGTEVHYDFNAFRKRFKKLLKEKGIKTYKKDRTAVYDAFSWKDEAAEPVIKKVHTRTLFDGEKENVVEYEPDTDLRDTENVPMQKGVPAEEAIRAYVEREVRPYVPDAWIDADQTKTGYEILFNKYFYRYAPPRPLREIAADIFALEAETENLLQSIVSE